MKPEDFGYVVKNNICLFQKGILSQWWGGWRGQNGGFSHEDIDYNCCEQWMMSQKAFIFNDKESFEKIMNETNPGVQKNIGRGIEGYKDEIWARYKYNIVLKGNRLKFEQNKDCCDFLLSFNKHTIFAEAAPWDYVWGIGIGPENPEALDINKWKGENLLGEAIGQVRRELNQALLG